MKLTRKEVNNLHNKAIEDGNNDLAYLIGDYCQLKYSWIPQIKRRFLGEDDGGLFTPHKCVLRKEVIMDWIKKYKL